MDRKETQDMIDKTLIGVGFIATGIAVFALLMVADNQQRQIDKLRKALLADHKWIHSIDAELTLLSDAALSKLTE